MVDAQANHADQRRELRVMIEKLLADDGEVHEQAGRIVSALQDVVWRTREPFWLQQFFELTKHLILLHWVLYGRATIDDLYVCVGMPRTIDQQVHEADAIVSAGLPPESDATTRAQLDAVKAWHVRVWTPLDPQIRQSILGSYRATLSWLKDSGGRAA